MPAPGAQAKFSKQVLRGEYKLCLVFCNQFVAAAGTDVVGLAWQGENVPVIGTSHVGCTHSAALDAGFYQNGGAAQARDYPVASDKVTGYGGSAWRIIAYERASRRGGNAVGVKYMHFGVDHIHSGCHYGDGRAAAVQGGPVRDDIGAQGQAAYYRRHLLRCAECRRYLAAPVYSVVADVPCSYYAYVRAFAEDVFRWGVASDVEADSFSRAG